MNAKEILLSNNYWVMNKKIVKEYGVETSLLLSVLSEADNIFGNEWFYQTAETIEELTGLSNYVQSKSITQLIKMGILEQKNMGMPRKRFFKLNYETISKQVFKKLEYCNSKNLNTGIQKTLNNKESTNKQNNKENNILPEEFLTISEKLKEKLQEFVEYRKTIKKPIKTEKPIKSLITCIGKEYINEDHLIQCIDKTMNSEWVGVKGEYVKYKSVNKELGSYLSAETRMF